MLLRSTGVYRKLSPFDNLWTYIEIVAMPVRTVLLSNAKFGLSDWIYTSHFTFQHHPTGAEVSGQFDTSAKVSYGHFSTGTELSRPPANIFSDKRPYRTKAYRILQTTSHIRVLAAPHILA